jgi:hypothetical protein
MMPPEFSPNLPSALVPTPPAARTCRPQVVVIDDFLEDPDRVRALALSLGDAGFRESSGYKGRRSAQHLDHIDPNDFERLLGRRITRWAEHDMCGTFQITLCDTPRVFHSDAQTHAAVLFLKPRAPIEAGLAFHRSRETGVRRAPSDSDVERRTYGGKLLDATAWDTVDLVGNVYNRLVLWDARLLHSAAAYFGTNLETGRLTQIFFFDCE